ncbi:MAG: hypothetical protein RLY66_252 [Candidatus Parcubacteria bacterium]|jgi:phosphoribosylaminoimidazolecarboxamide formyltransferase/IMP cyclohydrolase
METTLEIGSISAVVGAVGAFEDVGVVHELYDTPRLHMPVKQVVYNQIPRIHAGNTPHNIIEYMAKRALITVTNKTGVTEFAQALVDLGWEIVSTGGTANALKAADIPVTLVEQITGFPEMLDGRLKTLHPNIFGGILADRTKTTHLEAIAAHGIELFDMVVVNLYNFASEPSIEKIDIGGPSLIRAAAKNFDTVMVVVDPADYDFIINLLKKYVPTHMDRQMLATMAFQVTAKYDVMIAEHFKAKTDEKIAIAQGTH